MTLSAILRGLWALLTICLPLAAGDITGQITIHRKLTRPNVTTRASSYERGVVVDLEADPEMDPLAYERSHVVIYLEGPLRPEPGGSAVVEQKGRRFAPELVAVPAGATVTFPNRDLILHNVFSLSKVRTFDLGTYPKDQSRSMVFAKPGIVYVNCHLHPNMSATIVVAPNRWFAVADGSGQFEIKDVPAGEYTVVAWHKAAGFFREKAQVEENGVVRVDYFIPLPAAGLAASVSPGAPHP